MDLTLTAEQQLLEDSARRFLEERWQPSRVRELESSSHGHDPQLWAQVAALGWPGLVLPEEHGGAGRGMLELAVVAEQLGRAAASCPLLASTTLVALPLSWAGTGQAHAWLAALAGGRAVGALAHLEPGGGGDEWRRPAMSLERGGGGWRLSGAKELVAYAAVADVLLVSAALDIETRALVALERGRPGVGVRRQHALGGDPLYRVDLDVAVGGDDVVTADAAEQLLSRALDHAAVAGCAYAAGLARRALELSVRHAQERRQFGRPIGAFQAVAHRCADMEADVEAMRLLALQAAWALDHVGAPALEVGAAKAYTNEALRRVFGHAHQIHGALGFSMEHDLQLFTRRAKAVELSWGSVDRHRERVAQAMGL
ncbi:MAG TPA: acyl-CoA dehydrogenase [Acidimicrobiaceae bacterium]|nr:acyl-CoA dehydrogenase [Acidimicrobiaceae bacterium]